jgi:hypothetical protein
LERQRSAFGVSGAQELRKHQPMIADSLPGNFGRAAAV